MKPRHLQAYWPEVNVLIPRRFDPVSGEPDYNAFVKAEPIHGRSTNAGIAVRFNSSLRAA